jgi:hypothetical protein
MTSISLGYLVHSPSDGEVGPPGAVKATLVQVHVAAEHTRWTLVISSHLALTSRSIIKVGCVFQESFNGKPPQP